MCVLLVQIRGFLATRAATKSQDARPGLIVKDLSRGVEKLPVPVVNEVGRAQGFFARV